MEPVIKVTGLGKQYRLGGQKKTGRTLVETLTDSVKAPFVRRRPDETNSFWALKDVNFEIHAGDVVGIIGRNGAGKSTLLKILSRITDPTEGEIDINGRIGSLLEVGTGFHPELTGRENVYLNGAILGMKKSEIAKKFDEIVAFAGTEKFLDTPVKYYSSGMYTRLAFAVAAHLDPEILIVDEVLAVGDAEFQKKCLGKMKDVAGQGRTVLFVSHNLTAVAQLCDTGIMLRGGKIHAVGPIEPVIMSYVNANPGRASSAWVRTGETFDGEFVIPERIAVVTGDGEPVTGPLRNDQQYWVEIDVDVRKPTRELEIGYSVSTVAGGTIFWSFHTDGPESAWPGLGRGTVKLRSPWPRHLLNEGVYRIELLAAIHQQRWLIESEVNAPVITVEVLGGLSESPHFNHKRAGLLAPVFEWSTAGGAA